jgi:hypothetical protein
MALSNAVLFPHSLLPLHIFEPRYRDLLEHSLDGDRMFSVALMKRGIDEAVGIDDLCPVAGVGLIRACVGNENGTSNLVLQGLGLCGRAIPAAKAPRGIRSLRASATVDPVFAKSSTGKLTARRRSRASPPLFRLSIEHE